MLREVVKNACMSQWTERERDAGDPSYMLHEAGRSQLSQPWPFFSLIISINWWLDA